MNIKYYKAQPPLLYHNPSLYIFIQIGVGTKLCTSVPTVHYCDFIAQDVDN